MLRISLCTILFAVFLVGTIQADHHHRDCLHLGGICTLRSVCPTHNIAKEQDLCNSHHSNDFVCCYSVADGFVEKPAVPPPAIVADEMPRILAAKFVGMDVKTCRSHGGECTSSFCNSALIYEAAVDCMGGEKCCILV